MRPVSKYVVPLASLVAAGFSWGCSSAPGGPHGEPSTDGGGTRYDAGSALSDGGALGAANDAGASLDASSPRDGGGGDSGRDASSAGDSGHDATVTDGSPQTDATPDGAGPSILGASCPFVDAGAFLEAAHAPLPKMFYNGHSPLTTPEIVTFTFADTPHRSELEAFGATIASTQWFTEVTKDYCVPDGGPCIAPGRPGKAVRIPTAAPSQLADSWVGPVGHDAGISVPEFVVEQIAAAIDAGAIRSVDQNALYTFYFPAGSNFALDRGTGTPETNCNDFLGYHFNTTYGGDAGAHVSYAIINECPAEDGGVAVISDVTMVASHEIVEGVTDPWYDYLPGGFYLELSRTVSGWEAEPWNDSLSWGEAGDNCSDVSTSALSDWPLDAGFQVQRIWSASEAAKGHNPCVPVPTGEAYYNASTDKAVYVADVGVPFIVKVTAFTDAPRGPWRLDARDWTPGVASSLLSLEFVDGVDGGDGSDFLCANNGTETTLKVTLLSDPAAAGGTSTHEAYGAIISVDVAAPTAPGAYFDTHIWPFAVMTPATAASMGVGDAGVRNVGRRSDPRIQRRNRQASTRW